MKAYAIVIKGHPISEGGFHELQQSSKAIGNPFDIVRFEAVTPPQVDSMMKAKKLTWNYPDVGSVLDPWTELRKNAYGGRDPKRRVACSLSHYMLWESCVDEDQPILILEHDAVFVQRLDPLPLLESRYGVIGINSPMHATFSFNRYHEMIQESPYELMPPPMLASKEIPQGLPGNSAYIIKPPAAKHLLSLCHKYGLWPNDAIMCQQLCNFLGVSKTYYTRVQNLKSTTTL
jgi:GR25 family glycosyltransferase involved in LPS biosynthesis